MASPMHYKGRRMKSKEFYNKYSGVFPGDRKYKNNIDYNSLVAEYYRKKGFSVYEELPLPDWGIADILMEKDGNIYIVECKSEKDRNFKAAMGQVLSYTIQLREYGYNIRHCCIITRQKLSQGHSERLQKDVDTLNKYLPFTISIKKLSNKDF